jgi:hypothetical protein
MARGRECFSRIRTKDAGGRTLFRGWMATPVARPGLAVSPGDLLATVMLDPAVKLGTSGATHELSGISARGAVSEEAVQERPESAHLGLITSSLSLLLPWMLAPRWSAALERLISCVGPGLVAGEEDEREAAPRQDVGRRPVRSRGWRRRAAPPRLGARPPQLPRPAPRSRTPPGAGTPRGPRRSAPRPRRPGRGQGVSREVCERHSRLTDEVTGGRRGAASTDRSQVAVAI